jgi:hypothetical protein
MLGASWTGGAGARHENGGVFDSDEIRWYLSV